MSVCSEAADIIFTSKKGDSVLAQLCRHLDICTSCDASKAAEYLAGTALSRRMLHMNPLGQAMIQAQILGVQTFRRQAREASH